MKRISFLIFVLFVTSVQSQNTKQNYALAKVNYGVEIRLDPDSKKHKTILTAFPKRALKMETIDSEFDFTLTCNDSLSLFYLEKKLYSDNSAAELAIILSGYFGRIKQIDDFFITENLREDFGKFLVSRKYHNWELLNEKKLIGDYTCFKATTKTEVVNPEGKIFIRNYTAWYTPQLPYKYGPLGFGNLPGLIIELQGEDYTYGVKKIEFFDKDQKSKDNEIPKLKNKKLITEEEFEELAAMDEKRWRDKH